MASKRDLVEAHAYNRRRLVSAFLSGAPGGREVESVSRSRPVVAGVTLGGLLVGGAAIAGLFAQPLPDGWENGYVVIGKTSAARFVTIKGTLHPVLNATSARLILPSDKGFEVLVVDDSKIAATPHGSTLGILGAPDDLPPAASLVQTGWVSCFDGTKPTLTIGTAAAPAYADASGLTVTVTGSGKDVRYLLAAGRRYVIPTASYDPVKQYLGQLETPQAVTGTWVDLFNPGSDLTFESFGFRDRALVGKPLTGQYTLGNKLANVGQLVVNKDQNDAMSVMVANGTIPLTPFAAAVYQAVAPDGLGKPVTVSNDDLSRIQPSDTAGFVPEDWPTRSSQPRQRNSVRRARDRGRQAGRHPPRRDVGRLAVRQAGQQTSRSPSSRAAARWCARARPAPRVRSRSSTSPGRRSPSPTRPRRRWPGWATRTSPRATSRRRGSRCCRPVRRSARPRSARRRSTRGSEQRYAARPVRGADRVPPWSGWRLSRPRRPRRRTAPAPSNAPSRSTCRSARPR